MAKSQRYVVYPSDLFGYFSWKRIKNVSSCRLLKAQRWLMWKVMLDNILKFQTNKIKSPAKAECKYASSKVVNVVTGIELIVWLDSSWQEVTPGLSLWLSGKESACQCREHWFNPWSGKIPHAKGQLSLHATTTEAPQSPCSATREATTSV